MNKLALILPLAFVTQFAMAQNSASIPNGLDAERNLAELGNGANATMVRTYDNRYEGVKGSPFFNEEWGKATLTANNKLYHNVEVKYNVYENNILYKNEKGQEFILQPYKVDSFVLTDSKTQQQYQFKKLAELASADAKLVNQFVVALHDGKKTQLVMVPEKAMVKANFKGAYSNGNTYDELVNVQSFYFIGPDQKATKVKLNKKNLLKALPDKQEKVEAFASSKNLDLNETTGWAKALAYYETL